MPLTAWSLLQALVNDDTPAFDALPACMRAAARRLAICLVVGVLTASDTMTENPPSADESREPRETAGE